MLFRSVVNAALELTAEEVKAKQSTSCGYSIRKQKRDAVRHHTTDLCMHVCRRHHMQVERDELPRG